MTELLSWLQSELWLCWLGEVCRGSRHRLCRPSSPLVALELEGPTSSRGKVWIAQRRQRVGQEHGL